MRVFCFEIEIVKRINWKRIARSGWDSRLQAIKACRVNSKNKMSLREAKIKVDKYMYKKGLIPDYYPEGKLF